MFKSVATVFFLINATPAWLAKTPADRNQFVAEVLRPVIAKHPHVRLRYFDAEAYSARISDVMMWEVGKRDDYHALVEDLRETQFWGSYFDVQEIIATVEDGFAQHYRVEGFGASQRSVKP